MFDFMASTYFYDKNNIPIVCIRIIDCDLFKYLLNPKR